MQAMQGITMFDTVTVEDTFWHCRGYVLNSFVSVENYICYEDDQNFRRIFLAWLNSTPF